tara:strand:- start:13326 stop:13742 length:417 start_codon:yes stop_codon:yes gene_type:complete
MKNVMIKDIAIMTGVIGLAMTIMAAPYAASVTYGLLSLEHTSNPDLFRDIYVMGFLLTLVPSFVLNRLGWLWLPMAVLAGYLMCVAVVAWPMLEGVSLQRFIVAAVAIGSLMTVASVPSWRNAFDSRTNEEADNASTH